MPNRAYPGHFFYKLTRAGAFHLVFPQDVNKIHILSPGITLTNKQCKILSLSFNYIPYHGFRSLDVMNIILNTREYVNRLRWKYIFSMVQGKPTGPPELYIPKGTEASKLESAPVTNFEGTILELIQQTCNNWLNKRNKSFLPFKKPSKVMETIRSLQKKMLEWVFKPTDKNLGPCIISIHDYNNTMAKMLADTTSYKSLTSEQSLAVQQNKKFKFTQILERVRSLKWSMVLDYLLRHPSLKKPTLPLFYFIPKIHKSPWSTRPICAPVNWYTTGPAEVLAHFLHKFTARYRRDFILFRSEELIYRIQQINNTLATQDFRFLRLTVVDVNSMYTKLHLQDCMAAFDYFTQLDLGHEDPIITPEQRIILKMMLKLVLFDNIFHETVHGDFLQIEGIAMGPSCSPDIANLTILMYELQSLHQQSNSIDYILYCRFLDDILILFDSRVTESPSFKLPDYLTTSGSYGVRSIEYLDLKITILWDHIHYQVYQKELNSYSYPHYHTNFPKSIFKGLVLGELIRYARRSFTYSEFKYISILFKIRLQQRGYPLAFLNHYFKRVSYFNHRIQYNQIPSNTPKRVDPDDIYYYIFQYNKFDEPLFKQIKQIIIQYQYLLPKVIQRIPIFTYTLKKSVGEYLIRADFNQKLLKQQKLRNIFDQLEQMIEEQDQQDQLNLNSNNNNNNNNNGHNITSS